MLRALSSASAAAFLLAVLSLLCFSGKPISFRALHSLQIDRIESVILPDGLPPDNPVSGKGLPVEPPLPGRHTADWTILIYMTADNNLEQAGLDDLNEMEAADSSERVNVIAFLDRKEKGDARVYRVQKETPSSAELISQPLLAPLPQEPNMGDPANLAKFIEWTLEHYPAGRYALILWGHGLGWKGIGFDETSYNDSITPVELRSVLLNLKNSPEFRPTILAFDACLMQTAEVASVIARDNLAEYIIASEETVPGPGWNYEKVISAFNSDSEENIENLLAVITQSYIVQYPADKATLSALKSSSLGSLPVLLNGLADSLTLGREWDKAALARSLAENFGDSTYVDLYDFASNIRSAVTGQPAQRASEILLKYLENAVASNASNSTHPNARGLSIFFPEKGKPDGGYLSNTLYSERWNNFLAEYHTARNSAPPQKQSPLPPQPGPE